MGLFNIKLNKKKASVDKESEEVADIKHNTYKATKQTSFQAVVPKSTRKKIQDDEFGLDDFLDEEMGDFLATDNQDDSLSSDENVQTQSLENEDVQSETEDINKESVKTQSIEETETQTLENSEENPITEDILESETIETQNLEDNIEDNLDNIDEILLSESENIEEVTEKVSTNILNKTSAEMDIQLFNNNPNLQENSFDFMEEDIFEEDSFFTNTSPQEKSAELDEIVENDIDDIVIKENTIDPEIEIQQEIEETENDVPSLSKETNVDEEIIEEEVNDTNNSDEIVLNENEIEEDNLISINEDDNIIIKENNVDLSNEEENIIAEENADIAENVEEINTSLNDLDNDIDNLNETSEELDLSIQTPKSSFSFLQQIRVSSLNDEDDFEDMEENESYEEIPKETFIEETENQNINSNDTVENIEFESTETNEINTIKNAIEEEAVHLIEEDIVLVDEDILYKPTTTCETGHFEVFKVNNAYKFILFNNMGEILYVSVELADVPSCLTAVQNFKKCVQNGIFAISKDKFNLYKFILTSNEDKFIRYQGELYESQDEALINIDEVKKYISTAPIIFREL